MSAPAGRARLATALLLGVTAGWGSTFFLIRDLVESVPPADFLAVRFGIAAVVMFLLFRRQTLALSRRELRLGVVLGVLYGLAQLSLQGLAVGLGEALTLVAAVLYAGHIVALGRWSTPRAAVGLATVQAGVITVVTSVAAVPDGLTLPSDGGQWASLLYMALAAGALALWAQTWAQAHLTATRAAIVMAMEPVFAAFFAVVLGGEDLTRRMLVGGALVVAAMYLVELRSTSRDPTATAAEGPPVEAPPPRV